MCIRDRVFFVQLLHLPAEYAALDLRQMKELDEKYPVVAARVRSQLENGWEPTLSLIHISSQGWKVPCSFDDGAFEAG